MILSLYIFGLQSFWSTRIRKISAQESAERTRAFLEGLGGLWIKAGQLISLRTDLLTPEMAHELSDLQFRANGFSPDTAKQVVEASLGQPIHNVFDIFEELPFAAASISQVHRARLRYNGVWVAIKVQRPNIETIFARDLKLISWLLRQMNRIPALSFIKWDGMIRELQQIMREEIDYRYEVSNLRRLRKILRKHKIYVPKVYRQFSGQKIVVMEYITGVLMSDYLRLAQNDPQRVEMWRQENNVRPVKVGSRLLRSFYRQLFEDNLFHGDLHPGNIILLRNSRIALIDLGTLGNVEKRFIEIYKLQAKAFAERDYSKAADYYLLLCDSIPVADIDGFRADTVEVYRNWEARTHLQGLTFLEKSITGGVASEASDIARKYKVNPTWQLLRVARSLSTLDANLNSLLVDVNPNKIVRKYFRQARRREWKRLRKQGVGGIANIVGNSVSEVIVSGRFVTDRLRQEAIRFQGVQQKLHHFLEIVFRVIRWGLVVGGIVLLYDFLHQHHFNLVDEFHDDLGSLGQITELIGNYPYAFGIVLLLLVLLFIIATARLKNRFAQPTVRLPSGRLDT